ncbi:SIS domain-containing protein [Alphaproteobacteria bacterium]|nr:SIS domain-containing protein [Alphaproteobacteria bacterium]
MKFNLNNNLHADQILKENIEASCKIKLQIMNDNNFKKNFLNISNKILNVIQKQGRIYIAGNGGSAADAQHFATEFISKLSRDRNPLPAEALTTDSSIITAIGNDYGFEKIFSRQLLAKANPNDIFMGISTSGNSENILEAFKICNKMKVPTLLLGGNDGGEALKIAKYSIIIPSQVTSIIQECHIIAYHSICEYVENEIFFKD